MAFKPSQKRKVEPGSDELDLTPIMNLVVVLIPLLLATAEFVKLGLLETRLPSAGGASAASLPDQETPKEKMNLVVAVDSLGISVSCFNQTAETENTLYYNRIPRLGDGSLDFDALGEHLYDVHSQVVTPALLGEVQNKDEKGKPIFNPDGTPQMVNDYKYSDAEKIVIAAPNAMEFQDLVNLMDRARSYVDPASKQETMMFPSPLLGKVQ